MVTGVGWPLAVLLVLVIVGVLMLGTYKVLAQRGTAQTSPSGIYPLLATSEGSNANRAEKPTTEQLVHQLRSIDWFQFEQLVALVYRKQGYAVSRRGGANPDGGIDLVIEKAGTRTAVQCKHWKTWNVGVRAVRELLGALTDAGIQRGLFITLGGYTGDARQLADKHGIVMVNETELAAMLEATDARFDPAVLEILHDSRKLCPKCEREMVLRTAGRGPGAGKQFWGCSGYPRCRFRMSV
jgi:restriction system protein